MSGPATPEKPSSTSSLPYWGTAYSLAVGVLYLWGYWSPFKINVLEYVALSDLVKTAVYPIASVFIFMAVGAIAGELLFPDGVMPPGGGANTRAGIFLRRNLWRLIAGYSAITVLIFLFGPVEKWRILPVLVAIPASLALKSTGMLEDKIRHERVRSIAIFLIAILPCFAYGHGALKAAELISGDSYLYVVSKIEQISGSADATKFSKLRYIGKAGDHYFLFSPLTKNVFVVPQSEVKVLELASNRSGDASVQATALPASAAPVASAASK